MSSGKEREKKLDGLTYPRRSHKDIPQVSAYFQAFFGIPIQVSRGNGKQVFLDSTEYWRERSSENHHQPFLILARHETLCVVNIDIMLSIREKLILCTCSGRYLLVPSQVLVSAW
jgi:hypothetical protein